MDELTYILIDWINNLQSKDKPFFMYVFHKSVHTSFVTKDEDPNIYQKEKWSPPKNYLNLLEFRKGKSK